MVSYLLPSGAVVVGILLLVWSGDQLVNHAVHLARTYHMPKGVVGAIVLGFGTSLPELFVSVTDVFSEDRGIAIGNVVGSNIANVGLILGLGALLSGFRMEARVVRVDLPLALLVSVFLWLFCFQTGAVTRVAAAILLAGFVLYLVTTYRHVQNHRRETEREVSDKHPLMDVVWMLGGLLGIAVGAELLVYGAERIARLLEVSELFIGLTVVALGTSLPELATLIAAIRKGEGDLAVGNIAGSNIFNLLFVLGVATSIHPIPTQPVMPERDFPALTVFAILAFPLFSRSRRIGRLQGALMLAAYAGYWIWRSTA